MSNISKQPRTKTPRYELRLAQRAWGNANHALRVAEDGVNRDPHDGITPCPPESRCTECWPESVQETSTLPASTDEHVHDCVYAGLKRESCYCGATRATQKASTEHVHEWHRLPRGVNFCVTCGAVQDQV